MKPCLGIKFGPQHDVGAAIVWEDGDALRAVALSEERLNRQKESRVFPILSIKAVLQDAGFALSDLGMVCIDKLGSYNCATESYQTFRTFGEWGGNKGKYQANEREFILKLLEGGIPTRIVNHHLCHAATAYYPFNLKDATIIVSDGQGSRLPGKGWETQSVFNAVGHKITRKGSSVEYGLGVFYTLITKSVLGYDALQAGKTMGLAAYGDWTKLEEAIKFPDNIFQGVDSSLIKYLSEHATLHLKQASTWAPKLKSIPAPDVPVTEAPYIHYANWAQHWLEHGLLEFARYAVAQGNSRTLCAAGGTMLNVVANRKVRDYLMACSWIDQMIVQPASSDAGIPLGAALLGYYDCLGGALPFQKEKVYLGLKPDQQADQQIMLNKGAKVSKDLSKDVIDLILDGKVVGWMQGRSEYGPRALGNRSILAWPREAKMKDRVNLKIKHREAFRPFAPICRDCDKKEIFGVDFSVPYMLFNTAVQEEFLDKIPAVVHVDGSGRLQTVREEDNKPMHDLLTELRNRDQVGVLLNTSFNDAGEPIVESVHDALSCFYKTGLDALVVGNCILRK